MLFMQCPRSAKFSMWMAIRTLDLVDFYKLLGLLGGKTQSTAHTSPTTDSITTTFADLLTCLKPNAKISKEKKAR